MRRLVVALAFAAVLVSLTLIKPTAPTLTTPVDLKALTDIIKSDPALLAEAMAFLNKTRLNFTLPTPPSVAPTEIAIGANTTATWAGSHVAVSGRLTSRGRPVAGALIAVYLHGKLAALTQTDAQGRFNASVHISAYVPRANITAIYAPLPGSPYAPSSASIQLRVLFNATKLTLSVPATVQWGDPLRIEIRQSPPVERQVVVALSNGTSTVALRAVVKAAAVGVSTIVMGVLLPYLSSSGEPEAAAVKAYRLALAVSAPPAAALVTGGVHFLSILGRQYAEAAAALAVFTVADLIGLAAGPLGGLTYAKGLYTPFLAVGVAANVTRIVLYILLGSSDVGVAVSFLAGSLVAVMLYVVFQRPAAREMAAVTPRALLASLPALVLAPFGILPAAAGAVAGYALAVRLRLVTRGELADLARQIFPSNLYVRVAPVASKVLDVLD